MIHGIYQAYCVLIHMDGIYHTKYNGFVQYLFLIDIYDISLVYCYKKRLLDIHDISLVYHYEKRLLDIHDISLVYHF